MLLLLLLGVGGAYGGWRWTRPTPEPAPSPATSMRVPESEVLTRTPTARDLSAPPVAISSAVTVPAEKPVPPATPIPETPQAVAPKPVASKGDASSSLRWDTLRKGDWETALIQGSAHRAALKGAWVLRLEVACQPDTLARAVAAFKEPADLFIVPLAMRDGRTCRQVCFGHFVSEAEAQAALSHLPDLFREGGNKPHPFEASALPEKQ